MAGPPVCRALIARGALPRLIVRPESERKIPPEIRKRCRVTLGDLTVREFAENAAQGTSAIVHLAGSWKESHKGGGSFEEAIVHATDNVIHAAKVWGIARLLHLGTAGANPGDPMSFLDAMGKAEERVRNSGLSWTVFRPEPFYDLGDGTVRVTDGYLDDLGAAIAGALFRDDAIGCVYETFGGESGSGRSHERATR